MTLPPPPPRPVPRPVARRRHHRGIWLGAGLVVLGVLAAGAWLLVALPPLADDLDDFHRAGPDAPVDFTVTEPVDWVVFIEPAGASQSGFRFEIVDSSGTPVALGRDHGFTYGWSGRSGRSIASVSLEPGDYRMRVLDGSASVALGDSPGGRLFRALAVAVLVGAVPVIGGAVLLVVSAVRDTRERNRNAEPPPPSPWTSGEWPAAGPPGNPPR